MKTHYGTHHWPIGGLGLVNWEWIQGTMSFEFSLKIKQQHKLFLYHGEMFPCTAVMCFYADDIVLLTQITAE